MKISCSTFSLVCYYSNVKCSICTFYPHHQINHKQTKPWHNCISSCIRNANKSEAFIFYRKIGLCCVIIEGLTRGTSNKAEEIELKPHRWNAVRVDDRWRLVDICWAKRQYKDLFSKDFDSIYFCSDPNHLIYTHLPNNPKWQLVDPPISKERFLSFPLLKPHFFQSGLLLLEFSGFLETYNGSVRIPIGHNHYLNGRFVRDHFENTLFSFTFTEINSRSITGFVLQETKKDEEIFFIRLMVNQIVLIFQLRNT